MYNQTGQALAADPSVRREQRATARTALLIRGAKLISRFGEFLCVVRDVSETGIRLRLFHRLPLESRLQMELANGERFWIGPVWREGEEAGYRFMDPIDVHRFMAEPSSFPKRSLRLNLKCPADVSVNGQSFRVTIRNLSREGARIVTREKFALDQKVVLSFPGIEQFDATVRWRNSPAYGLALGRIFTFEQLARTAAIMQMRGEG